MFGHQRDHHEGRGFMSATTIQVPPEHVASIRRSLSERRDATGGSEEIERLLDQIGGDAPAGTEPRVLVGSRAVLWSAIYDSLCADAERLADELNEYWRGVVDPESARARTAAVAAGLELLIALGAPPVR
jgi:hypothetical protein